MSHLKHIDELNVGFVQKEIELSSVETEIVYLPDTIYKSLVATERDHSSRGEVMTRIENLDKIPKT